MNLTKLNKSIKTSVMILGGQRKPSFPSDFKWFLIPSSGRTKFDENENDYVFFPFFRNENFCLCYLSITCNCTV